MDHHLRMQQRLFQQILQPELWLGSESGERRSEQETSRNFLGLPLPESVDLGREWTLQKTISFPVELRFPLTCLSAVEKPKHRGKQALHAFIGQVWMGWKESGTECVLGTFQLKVERSSPGGHVTGHVLCFQSQFSPMRRDDMGHLLT